MEKKTSIIIMPLFIKRLRSFVKNPTMKEWSAVSRLVRNADMRYAFQYGVKGYLPVIMCSNSTASTCACESCPFNCASATYYWRRDNCLVYNVLQCSKLSDRLLKGTRLLAIYDAYDTISSYYDVAVEKEILSSERKLLRNASSKRKRPRRETLSI